MALNIFGYPVATGGGTSVTAVAFYLVSRPDEFESQDGLRLLSVQNLFSLGVGLFPSSFLFSIITYHCTINQL